MTPTVGERIVYLDGNEATILQISKPYVLLKFDFGAKIVVRYPWNTDIALKAQLKKLLA